MRELKEPEDFKYPRLYWSPDFHSGAVELRIIYPDGREPDGFWRWTPGGEGKANDWDDGLCWYKSGMSPAEQVDALKYFCARSGNEICFVGEIK